MPEEYTKIEGMLYKHWNEIFDFLCANEDLNIHEFSIEIQLKDGFTIRKSWNDSQHRLADKDT